MEMEADAISKIASPTGMAKYLKSEGENRSFRSRLAFVQNDNGRGAKAIGITLQRLADQSQ